MSKDNGFWINHLQKIEKHSVLILWDEFKFGQRSANFIIRYAINCLASISNNNNSISYLTRYKPKVLTSVKRVITISSGMLTGH
jgi:hypothetical protein